MMANRNMHRLLLTAGLWLALVTSTSCSKLVCYYNREAASRVSSGRFTPASIDSHLCTHIIFAFAIVDNQNDLIPVASTDTTLYAELNNLKKSNPQLKTLLAVGGPNFDNQRFSTMVASASTRTKFVNSAITFLQTHGFDGLNLDWRYPGDAASQPQDKNRFVDLCQELKAAFTGQSLIVSASVAAEKSMIDSSYPNPAAIATALDFLNVLTFDFHDTTESVTAHHSPLGALSTNPADTLTTQYAMNYWKILGAPAAKLNMGIAAFGVAWTLADPKVSGVGAATTGPAEEGCYGGTPGLWSYYEICLYTDGGDLQWISDQSVPYAVTEGQWVGYDNTGSIDAKVAHITANGYGGACVWSLDLDDYTGQFCNSGINPFISHLQTKLPAVISSSSSGSSSSSSSNPKPSAPQGSFCNGKSGVHPNPGDQTTYYNCDHGIATLQTCSPGLVFKAYCSCCDYP